jgi:hypothetical protein
LILNTKVVFIFTEEWKIGKNLSSPRGDFAIGVIEDKVICAGGLGMLIAFL